MTQNCSAYFTCFCACAQGDISCYGGCQPKFTSACQACSSSIMSCEQQHCASECGVDAGTGGGTGGGGGGVADAGDACGTLATCCGMITDAQTQAGCQSVVGTGNAQQCQATYSGFKGAGYCQ